MKLSQLRWYHIAALACLTLTGCAEHDDVYRIVVIPKGLTHEFWQSIHRGADRAASDLDALGMPTQVIFDGPLRERDSMAQIRIVDRRVSTRVNGIVLAPQHSQTMVAPVQRAVKEGIPVVIIDSGLENPELFIKYVATDNYRGGWLAAEHLIKVLKEDGKTAPKIIMLRYQVGSESTEKREQGFEDYINKAIKEQKSKGEPTITWLSNDKYGGATKDSALKESAPLVNRFRDQIDGIFAPNESSASGMLDALRGLGLSRQVRRTAEPNDALKQAVTAGLIDPRILTQPVVEVGTKLLGNPTELRRLGLQKQIHLMGFDSSEPLLQAVRDGEVDGLILQDPYKMGYLSVWTLVHYLRGYNVIADGKKEVSTGEHVITLENLDNPATIELFSPAAQAKRKIEPPTFIQKMK